MDSKMKNILAILLALLSISAVASAGTYTIKVSEDTYCETINPDTPVGSYDDRYLRTGWMNGITIGHSYFKFDLSGIPANEEITSIKFYAYCNLFMDGSSATDRTEVHYCSDDSWSDHVLTWNNQPAYDPAALDSKFVPGALGWYSWEVSQAASTNNDDLLTLVLDGNNEYGGGSYKYWRDFEMEEYSGNNEAYIIVETQPLTAPEFGSIAIAVAALLTTTAFAYMAVNRNK